VKACAACRLADATWFPRHAPSFAGTLRWRHLDDLVLVQVAADRFGCRFEEGSAGSGYVGLAVAAGPMRERVVRRDRTSLTVDAEVAVWDNAALLETEFLTPVSATILMVPKQALRGSRGADFEVPHLTEVSESPSLDLLRGLLPSLAREGFDLDPAAALAVRGVVLELVLAATGEHVPVSTAAVSAGMREDIVRWVDDRLRLGEVGPHEAATHHGISVRSLHRLFSDTGETFSAMVRTRRLSRARHDLAVTDDTVQAVAARWGYADASHFIREFKRQYRLTPTGYRRGLHQNGAPDDATS
jgi:AraC family transcriptional activator of tynA and feaB